MHKPQLLHIFITLLFISTYNNASAQLLNEKQTDSLLTPITDPNGPGFSVGIIKNNKLIYGKGFGLADIENKVKITVETPFNIASNSKQFTAACIYLLEAQGKLKTTDKLSKYFTDLPKYADSITIAHLIHHQSGLRDFPLLAAWRNIGDFNGEKNIYQLLAAQKALDFKPGTQSAYSNSGYFFLSLIVKKLSGKDLADFAKQYIFKPLKMSQTSFSRSHLIAHKANGYVLRDNQFHIENPTDTTIGQGNIYSNVPGLKKWLYEIKTHKHLGEKIWQKMLTITGSSYNYGGGLEIETVKNRKRISHGGDLDGYHSNMYYFPKEDIGMIILSNKENISIPNIYAKLEEAVFGKDTPVIQTVKTEEKTMPASSIAFDTVSYIGTYRMTPGVIFDVSNIKGQLSVYQRWNGITFKLFPKTKNLFYADFDPNVTFEFKNIKDNKAQELELLQGGKVTKIMRTTIDINLVEYTGQFYNEELETTYTFIVKDEKLEFSSNKEAVRLTATDKDYFYSPWGKINFGRDKDGKINGFFFNHSRIKNMRFVKTKP